ncbi:MAG TPA: hypothetical protein VK207_00150 [Bacteroidales bacterium]|nr:hypothetical protein [Bacteroidales bacterium]
MRNKLINLVLFLFLLLISSSCYKKPGGVILVMGKAGDGKCPDSVLNSGSLKIGLINPGNPNKPVKMLTDEFYSACSPSLSFDARSMVFAGRRNAQDQWQIWEMDLRNRKVKRITQCTDNCLFPAYLPGSKIVFSRLIPGDSLKSELSLFRCNTDGSACERITFNPATWYSPTVLADGRILAKSARYYPEKSQAELMVLRPDGTKAELFYERKGELTGGKAIETADGKIIFTENTGNDRSQLVAVRYDNPFDGSAICSKDFEGDFISVNRGFSGKVLACYRNSHGETYRLFEIDPETESCNLIHENKDYDILEAIAIEPQNIPRKLPSEVDNLVKTGLIMCQNINTPAIDPQNQVLVSKMEILGLESSYGKIYPEPDGSFYLKVMADKPFRFATLDKNGNVIKMCNWMTLRPNERRGCTGCHEDPQITPENRIPMAVKKDPVIIPVIINKIEEKIVELE